MTSLPTLLAALPESDQLILKNMARSGWSQMTIILGSLGAVAVIAFLFVFIFRKRLFRKRRRHNHEHRAASVAAAPGIAEDDGDRSGKKGRRRKHRPLNPTLAQTRGLPPIREEGQPPMGL